MEGDEDCLTLDVITPYVRNENLLPVVVTIGADTLNGPSPGKLRPSTRYSRSRDIVFVRPNFRLSVLGFLANEELTNRSRSQVSGNYGLTDIVQALQWISLNIRNFGGDPESVTLFSHKAGATLALALALSEHSLLFHQVWAASGSALLSGITLDRAQVQNERFVYDHNCTQSNDTLQCMYDLDATELMDAIPADWKKPDTYELPSTDHKKDYQHHWLIHSNGLMNINGFSETKRLKFVLGTTEHASYTKSLEAKYQNWNATAVKNYVNSSIIGHRNLTDSVFQIYPATFKGLLEIITDIRIGCPLYELKKMMKSNGYTVVFYKVNQSRMEEPKVADIDSDIEAILGRYEPKSTEQRRFFASIQQFFYYFVSHGMFQKPYEPDERLTQYLKIGQDIISVANYSRCAFWKQHDFVSKYGQLE